MRTNHKRFISLLMALIMSLSLLATTAFAYDYSDIPDGAETLVDNDGNIIGYIDPSTGYFVTFDEPIANPDIDSEVPTETPVEPTWDVENPVVDDDNTGFTDEDLALVTSFKDVKSAAWYYSDVTECAKLGIVAGFEDGTFRPDNSVTDVQWVTMVTRTFYNADVEAAQRSKPAGSAWYWANTKVAADKYLTNAVTVSDKNMTRYDMAQVVYNVLRAQNKAPSTAERNATQSSIGDYSSVPQNRQIAVKGCYATGLIAGMSDGKFHGEKCMNRAQACTVIVRMLKLLNNYNPGDKDNEQYDDGKTQVTGTLANGQPATVENVEAILAQIKQEYPQGTLWANNKVAPNTNYYKDGPISATDKTRDFGVLNSQFKSVGSNNYTSLKYACGGWACMVSERIFGKTGAPARRVTELKDVRPGDITYIVSADGKATSHIGIVSEVRRDNNGNTIGYKTCDGNTIIGNDPGVVNWGESWLRMSTYRWVFTRYPETETESEMP